jgi:hypothetical protein
MDRMVNLLYINPIESQINPPTMFVARLVGEFSKSTIGAKIPLHIHQANLPQSQRIWRNSQARLFYNQTATALLQNQWQANLVSGYTAPEPADEGIPLAVQGCARIRLP